MDKFLLTDENYYSPAADRAYLSCSQYQNFLECEARALAEIQGRWKKEDKEAYLVGNYFHSSFESPEAHERFCSEHFTKVFKTKTDKKSGEITITGKYAPYVKADEMIRAVRDDPMMKRLIDLPGNNEQFMTGEIWGVPWRMKMDKYIPSERIIIDYKTVANIWDTFYSAERNQRVSFIEAHGYTMRAAVYSMIEMQNAFSIDWPEAYENLQPLSSLPLPDFLLLCVSKQDPPDKEIIRVNHKQNYIYALETIKKKLARIVDIKDGVVAPKRCGQCSYCRATKKVSRVRAAYELMPEWRASKMELEDDHVEKLPQILA